MSTSNTQEDVDTKAQLVRSAASTLERMTKLVNLLGGTFGYDRASADLLTQVTQMCEDLKAKINAAAAQANANVEVGMLNGSS
jgi:hypothetical protein